MRKRWFLLAALAVSGMVVAVLGWLLRGALGEELIFYQDKPVIAVPFLLLTRQEDWAFLRKPERPLSTRPSEPQPSQSHVVIKEPPERPTEPVNTTIPETQPTEPETTAQPEPRTEAYFDDALFIGDSRTDGWGRFAHLGQADYFADTGMTVYRLFREEATVREYGETDLRSLLKDRTYGQIYVMLGLNEAGYPLDSLLDAYASDVQEIQTLQPQATIYLLQVFGVSREMAESTSYFRPERLQELNEGIAALCNGESVICLDPRGVYEDADGYLMEKYSDDGAHPNVECYRLLSDWLLEQ